MKNPTEDELFRQTRQDVEAARLPIAELVSAMLEGPNHDPVDVLAALATVTAHLGGELFERDDFCQLLASMLDAYDYDRALAVKRASAN